MQFDVLDISFYISRARQLQTTTTIFTPPPGLVRDYLGEPAPER